MHILADVSEKVTASKLNPFVYVDFSSKMFCSRSECDLEQQAVLPVSIMPKIATVALAIVVTLCVCAVEASSADGHRNGADVVIIEPQSSTSVVYSAINFKIGVVLHPGSILQHRTYICISEVGSSSGDLCVEEGIFTVSGFASGTHFLIASLRTFADEDSFQSGNFQLMGTVKTVIDTIDGPYLIKHARDSQLSHRILHTNPALSRYDYLFMHNDDRSLVQADVPYKEMTLHPREYTVIGRPGVAALETESVVVNQSLIGMKRVAIFMTSHLNLPPSDRYRDWLCEHTAFAKHGYELAIVAADNGVDDGVHDICGVTVQRFKCLSLDYAGSHTVKPEDLQDAAAQDTPQLAAYLSTTDVVIIGNTYGDHQTSLLLDVIHYMRNSAQELHRDVMKGTAPRVMIDLPNLEVPNAWHSKIDALIAPSKATGLHRLSITLDKPIAVIYPPVRDNVISSSLCAVQYNQYCTLHGTCSSHAVNAAAVTAATTAVTDISITTTAVVAPENQQHHSVVRMLNEQVFNFLFVGRLAAVKCPGLVVRALGYLLRSTYWAALPAEYTAVISGDGSGSGDNESEAAAVVVDPVDREFYSDLLAVARQFAPEVEGEGAAVEYLLESFRHNARATFIGNGELIVSKALRDLAFSLNVSDVVSLDGPQAPENVIKYMQQADVLVNPIVRGETFGFIHIEAAAQGLPVIAFNMSANSESIIDMDVDTAHTTECDTTTDAADASTGTKVCNKYRDSSVGRILPFRDKYVIQDLALAMLRAFVNSAQSIDTEVAADTDMGTIDGNSGAVSVDSNTMQGVQRIRRYAYNNRVRNVTAICERVVPMFAYWNVQQHGRALMQAMDRLLA